MNDNIPQEFLLNDVEIPNVAPSTDSSLSSFCARWNFEMMIMEKPFEQKEMNGFFVTIKKKDDDKFIFTSRLFPTLKQAKESLLLKITDSLSALSSTRVMDELL